MTDRSARLVSNERVTIMSGFDGTGPKGTGPLTGRGRGKCVGIFTGAVGKTLTAIIIPAVGIVVNDIRKPDGITRNLFASVKSRINRTMLKNPEVGYLDRKKNAENGMNKQ